MWRARITVHFRLVSRWIPRPTVLHELGSQWRRRGETAGNSHAVCIVAARSGTRVPRHKTGRCHEKARNHRRCGAAAEIADPDFSGADTRPSSNERGDALLPSRPHSSPDTGDAPIAVVLAAADATAMKLFWGGSWGRRRRSCTSHSSSIAPAAAPGWATSSPIGHVRQRRRGVRCAQSLVGAQAPTCLR